MSSLSRKSSLDSLVAITRCTLTVNLDLRLKIPLLVRALLLLLVKREL